MKQKSYDYSLIDSLKKCNIKPKSNLKKATLKSLLILGLPYIVTYLGTLIGTEKFKMFAYGFHVIFKNPVFVSLFSMGSIISFIREKQKFQFEQEKFQEINSNLEEFKKDFDIKTVDKINENTKGEILVETTTKEDLKQSLLIMREYYSRCKKVSVYVPENDDDYKKIKSLW